MLFDELEVAPPQLAGGSSQMGSCPCRLRVCGSYQPNPAASNGALSDHRIELSPKTLFDVKRVQNR
jgi:hypothetical protein